MISLLIKVLYLTLIYSKVTSKLEKYFFTSEIFFVFLAFAFVVKEAGEARSVVFHLHYCQIDEENDILGLCDYFSMFLNCQLAFLATFGFWFAFSSMYEFLSFGFLFR